VSRGGGVSEDGNCFLEWELHRPALSASNSDFVARDVEALSGVQVIRARMRVNPSRLVKGARKSYTGSPTGRGRFCRGPISARRRPKLPVQFLYRVGPDHRDGTRSLDGTAGPEVRSGHFRGGGRVGSGHFR